MHFCTVVQRRGQVKKTSNEPFPHTHRKQFRFTLEKVHLKHFFLEFNPRKCCKQKQKQNPFQRPSTMRPSAWETMPIEESKIPQNILTACNSID